MLLKENEIRMTQNTNKNAKTWTEADVEAFCRVASDTVGRMLMIGLETAARPVDLVELEDNAVLENEAGGTSWLRFPSPNTGRRQRSRPGQLPERP